MTDNVTLRVNRRFALEQAIMFAIAHGFNSSADDVVAIAKAFEAYLNR